MHIGDLEIYMVSDGIVYLDAGGPFGLVPRALYRDVLTPDERNRVPVGLHTLVIRSGGKTILVDTGLGEKLEEVERRRWGLVRQGRGLLTGLSDLGIKPEEVDLVINTHLHSDHCGGNTVGTGLDLQPTFPRAKYLVQRLEWAEASNPNDRTAETYNPQNFQPLVRSGQMELLYGDLQLTEHVWCYVTPGHTRGHQSIVLKEGDWYGFFPADLAMLAILMARTSWASSYDTEPQETLRTKKSWQQWALERDPWLFFVHDALMPIARLQREDGRLKVRAVEQAKPITDSLPTPPPLPG